MSNPFLSLKSAFLILKIKDLFSVLPTCISAPCVYSVHAGQKMVLDPLELEFQTVGGHHTGAGN